MLFLRSSSLRVSMFNNTTATSHLLASTAFVGYISSYQLDHMSNIFVKVIGKNRRYTIVHG